MRKWEARVCRRLRHTHCEIESEREEERERGREREREGKRERDFVTRLRFVLLLSLSSLSPFPPQQGRATMGPSSRQSTSCWGGYLGRGLGETAVEHCFGAAAALCFVIAFRHRSTATAPTTLHCSLSRKPPTHSHTTHAARSLTPHAHSTRVHSFTRTSNTHKSAFATLAACSLSARSPFAQHAFTTAYIR